MDKLKQKILEDGYIIPPNILKVDHFINHQIDIELFIEIGKAFKEYFKDKKVTRILTVEASGIAVASLTAIAFDNIPVVFAKKEESKILKDNVYRAQVHSFTKDRDYNMIVDKRFITEDDHVLIVDDFLANGQAVMGLKSICDQAGASIAGVGIVIEKGFQDGHQILVDAGLDVYSLASIKAFEDGKVILK